ncbi:MAG: type II toxin-antitoxin system VapC family toxin [Oscillospiraceae bacterium]|nr:type II toxin-antitoxin system VapC family toxin [Oscillospiraceae bacterium]
MKYMLDTNMCIYLMKNVPEVLSAFSANKDSGISISAVTLAELEFGVCNSTAYENNRIKLINFLTIVDILPLDDSAAAVYGGICAVLKRKGTPIGQMDMLIAAHAKSEELILVTNNIREFERVDGLKLENWIISSKQ